MAEGQRRDAEGTQRRRGNAETQRERRDAKRTQRRWGNAETRKELKQLKTNNQQLTTNYPTTTKKATPFGMALYFFSTLLVIKLKVKSKSP